MELVGGVAKQKPLVRPVTNRAPALVRGVPEVGPVQQPLRLYRFSAFWLRSSVVSVLISLISDMSSI